MIKYIEPALIFCVLLSIWYASAMIISTIESRAFVREQQLANVAGAIHRYSQAVLRDIASITKEIEGATKEIRYNRYAEEKLREVPFNYHFDQLHSELVSIGHSVDHIFDQLRSEVISIRHSVDRIASNTPSTHMDED